jgi:hypothetical protein
VHWRASRHAVECGANVLPAWAGFGDLKDLRRIGKLQGHLFAGVGLVHHGNHAAETLEVDGLLGAVR